MGERRLYQHATHPTTDLTLCEMWTKFLNNKVVSYEFKINGIPLLYRTAAVKENNIKTLYVSVLVREFCCP